jgi:hypothetical protein
VCSISEHHMFALKVRQPAPEETQPHLSKLNHARELRCATSRGRAVLLKAFYGNGLLKLTQANPFLIQPVVVLINISVELFSAATRAA